MLPGLRHLLTVIGRAFSRRAVSVGAEATEGAPRPHVHEVGALVSGVAVHPRGAQPSAASEAGTSSKPLVRECLFRGSGSVDRSCVPHVVLDSDAPKWCPGDVDPTSWCSMLRRSAGPQRTYACSGPAPKRKRGSSCRHRAPSNVTASPLMPWMNAPSGCFARLPATTNGTPERGRSSNTTAQPGTCWVCARRRSLSSECGSPIRVRGEGWFTLASCDFSMSPTRLILPAPRFRLSGIGGSSLRACSCIAAAGGVRATLVKSQ